MLRVLADHPVRGGLIYGSSEPGSSKHMAAELYRSMTGTDILHVPYKSSSGARNDLIGGHVRMMFDDTPSVAPNVLAGQLRALGTTGAQQFSPTCRPSRKQECRAISTPVGPASWRRRGR